MLARAAAAAAGARTFVLNGPEAVSEYFGESEASLRGIFAAAAALAPSVRSEAAPEADVLQLGWPMARVWLVGSFVMAGTLCLDRRNAHEWGEGVVMLLWRQDKARPQVPGNPA